MDSSYLFLSVTCGDKVIVSYDKESKSIDDYWAGEVIHVVIGARGKGPSIFQISCLDTGVIRTVNADLIIDKFKE